MDIDLDILLAENIMGFVPAYKPNRGPDEDMDKPTYNLFLNSDPHMEGGVKILRGPWADGYTWEPWSPTSNIADAMEVVAQILKDKPDMEMHLRFETANAAKQRFVWKCYFGKTVDTYANGHKDMLAAICMAAAELYELHEQVPK